MTDEFTIGPARRHDPSAFDAIVFLVLLTIAGLGYGLPPLNIDEGAILDFAGRMLDGQVLYRDLVDVNPPMIFLLNLIPASISRATTLPAPLVITGCVLVIPLLTHRSTLGFVGLMSDSVGATRTIALAAIYLLVLYPGAEFSQREHLLLLTMLPYLYNLHSAMAPGGKRSMAARLFEVVPFAVMVCQKPYFALVPAFLEWMASRRRSVHRGPRMELLLLLGLGAAYFVATALFFPAYLRRILPLAEHLYGIASPRLAATAFFGVEGSQLLLAIMLLSGVYLTFLRRLWLKLLLLCIGLLYLEAALQLKDWSYHFLPARALVILTVVACAATLLADRLQHGCGTLMRKITEVIVLPPLLIISLGAMLTADPGAVSLPYAAQRRFPENDWASVRKIVAAYARGGRVMWLSQYNDGPAGALAYAQARLISPTMSLWMLPPLYSPHAVRDGVVVYHDPAQMPPDEKWLWGSISEAFVKLSPSVVVDVVDDPGIRPGRFDYVDYFSTNPKFHARFSSYRKVYEDGVARVYLSTRSALLTANR